MFFNTHPRITAQWERLENLISLHGEKWVLEQITRQMSHHELLEALDFITGDGENDDESE